MGRYRAAARRVKVHRSYTVEEAARTLGIHKNTVRRWATARFFPVIAEARPHLILGRDLKTYLESRESARTRLAPGECYCLPCKAARIPALGMVEISSSNGLTVNVQGLCSDCEGFMYRRVSIAKLADIFPALEFPLPDGQRHLKVRDGCCSKDDFGDP